uniref:Arginine/serine-rich protein PNISR n=1 Tax=Culex pipiens TaxID=7175 RepID=A0A8D8HSS2_CULPI
MYARSSRNGGGQNGANPGGRAGMAAAITPVVKNYQTVRSSSSDGTDWNSLNPNLYQNMSNDQVDWAALAQQWIQMKETLPPEMVPAAPPPPPVISWNRSPPAAAPLETIDEQGEAPMEVEKEEDPGQPQQQRPQPGAWQNGSIAWQYPTVTAPEWRSSAWETSWSTGGNQGGNSGPVPPAAVNPQASVAVANWQAKMSRIYKINDGSGSSVSSEPIAGTVQPAAANSKQVEQGSKRIPGLMDQVINLDHASEDAGQADQDQGEDTTQTINDAKRKLLPAWIREGLEKMEREKQRQVERERDQKQREQLLEQRRQAELEALSELESAKKKSKFESDSEEEEAPDEQEGPSREASPVPARSREEILQELMISVRKNLTEILLEVTNEEIAVLAKETLAKARRKGSRPADRFRANSGSLCFFSSFRRSGQRIKPSFPPSHTFLCSTSPPLNNAVKPKKHFQETTSTAFYFTQTFLLFFLLRPKTKILKHQQLKRCERPVSRRSREDLVS